MTDKNRIDFGTVGLGMGEEIVFTPTGFTCMVGSGIGIPGNGGSLVKVLEKRGERWSIRAMTRQLLGDELASDLDPWALWEHQGETLRSRYERHMKSRQS